jgi:SpoIID/LytB domain protein
MGQWGAKGLADQGKAYTQILQTYYPGTTFGTRTPTEDIRVLVETSSDVVVSSDHPFTARLLNNSVVATSDATYRYFKVTWDGTNYHLYRSTAWNGTWSPLRTGTQVIVFKPGTAMVQVIFNSGSIHVYRGAIEAHQSGSSINSINDLTMQQYLYGVVPRESSASWPAEELKSQAIAARTYAARRKDTSRSARNSYDICTTSSCQSYVGYGTKSSPTSSVTVLEAASTNAAIDGTAGRVLMYGGAPILAEYSSSTGGYTAASSLPYQKAVPDPGDVVSPHHDWTASMAVSEIEARWPSIGRLVDVTVTQRNGYGDWGGRVLQMNIVGTNGTATMSGYGFMNVFAWPGRSNGLQGNWFTPLFWRGVLQSAPAAVTMFAGESKTITVRITNTGTASWPVGGNVHLATYSASAFATTAWTSSTRAPSITRNVTDPTKSSVGPGQVAEFRIPLSAANMSPGSYSQRFALIADNQSVTSLAFTVGVQVLVPWVEGGTNLLSNGSFEPNAYGWHGGNLTSGDGPTTAFARDGSLSFRITGGGAKTLTQTVPMGASSQRSFLIGGWNRTDGSATNGGPVQITATATYTDGTTSATSLPFARGPHPWIWGERTFTTLAKPLASISVGAGFANQTGQAFFDAIRLQETPITNPSFEQGLTGWTPSGLQTGDRSTTADKRDGGAALLIQGASGTKSVSQSIPLSGARNERFVLSGWNKASAPSSSGGAIAVTLGLHRTDGTTAVVTLPFNKAAHGWTFGDTGFSSVVAFTSATITATVSDQSGNVLFDDLEIARTWPENPGFENGLNNWGGVHLGTGDGVVTSPRAEGAHSLALTGSDYKVVLQNIGLSGGPGRTFVLSGWNRMAGSYSSTGRSNLLLRIGNADGTVTWFSVPFPRAAHGWVYAEGAFKTTKAFTSVLVEVASSGQTATAYFDRILVRNG